MSLSAFLSRPRALVVAATLVLLAQVTSGAGGPSPDPPTFSADLAVTGLNAAPSPNVMAGSTITYSIDVVNNGPNAAGNAWVKLPTPPHTTFVSAGVASGAGWTFFSAPAVGLSGDVIFSNSSGPAIGAAAQLQVVVLVSAGTKHYTDITATASIYTTDPGTADPNPANDSASVTTNAMTVADPAEPNETSGTAYELPLGMTSNLLYSSGDTYDSDWYKFYVPPGDAGKDLKVNVHITSAYPDPIPEGWGSDLDFDLMDGTLAERAIAVSASDNETLYLHSVASGWYYISILYSSTAYPESDRFARYSVTIETGTSFPIGYVNGRVVDGDGNGVEQVIVQAYAHPYDWRISFVSATTGTDGYFTVASPPGEKYLFFTGDGTISPNHPEVNVVDEFYLDQPSRDLAGYVTVYSGAPTDVGTITVAAGAIVTGQVTNMSASPLNGATVSVYDTAGNRTNFVYTDASGNYTITRVSSPGAKIRFGKSGYGVEWYDDQPSFATGATLATSPGTTLSGINAQLATAGQISGTVKDSAGNGLAVSLVLYSTTDAAFSRATLVSTAGTGAFSFGQLKAGTYKLYVNPTGTAFGRVWYNGANSFSSATPISVSTGTTTPGINVVLGVAGGGDFTGDLQADILWRHATQGDIWLWAMDGGAPQAETYVRTLADANWEIRAVADFTGDRMADLMWRNKATGEVYLWTMSGAVPTAETYVGHADLVYDIVSAGDYSGDGKADLLWRNPANGELWAWMMNGAVVADTVYGGTVDPIYAVKGSGDLNGDGLCDLVWQQTATGEVWVWLVRDGEDPLVVYAGMVPDLNYRITAVADFGGDGLADILWHHATNGEVWVWTMNGGVAAGEALVGTVPDTAYGIVSTGDYNGDRKADILWWNSSTGEVWVWLMNGAAKLTEAFVGVVPDTGYRIVR